MRLSLFSALLFPALPSFRRLQSSPLSPPARELCTGTLPVSGRLPSLRAQAPIQKFSVFSLFMTLSSLLPHFRELSLSPWRPGAFCCHLEVAGGLPSMGSHRVGHDFTFTFTFTFTFHFHALEKWQPTPAFLPGESQGRGSMVGCFLWGRTESDATDAT